MQEPTGTDRKIEGTSGVPTSAAKLAFTFSLDAIRIEPLSATHHRGAFCCSNEKIQNYCRFNALKNNDAYMVRVFVACHGNSMDVLGYYYLSLTSYKISKSTTEGTHLDDASDRKFGRYESVPAVYLGMIGVHSELERRGIGKLLMLDAIQRTAKIALHAGLYALTLDALDEDVAAYYREKFEFQTFQGGTNGLEMFLPISAIMTALPDNA